VAFLPIKNLILLLKIGIKILFRDKHIIVSPSRLR
jgi:hypothetical protein